MEPAPGRREQENKGVMEQREVEMGVGGGGGDDPQAAVGTITQV